MMLIGNEPISLVGIIPTQQAACLSYSEKVRYLREAAQKNNNPNYNIVMDAIKLGESNKLTSQQQQKAYCDFLFLINSRLLIIDRELFFEISTNIIAETQNYAIMLIFGGLLCGTSPILYPDLPEILKLWAPDLGFQYLHLVVVESRDKDLALNAQGVIDDGLVANIFTNEFAKSLPVKMLIEIDDTLQSSPAL